LLTSTLKVPLTGLPHAGEGDAPLDSKITLRAEKTALRAIVLARRDLLDGRDGRSARIHARVLALPAWTEAHTISSFVGVQTEVATLPLLEAAFAAGKRVAVPVVEGANLTLYRIDSTADLAPAPFGLLEPRKELRRKPRRVMPTTVGLYLVPGVAFDRSGGRLGYGKGFYDGLLRRVKPDVPKVALCFDVQMVPEVPMGPEDQRIPLVITEAAEYLCVPSPAGRS
jgi:5-formyltetrahydrofolate cyclo-ligase